MKKILSSILMFSLVVCCMFMMACSPAGTYKFESLSYSAGGISVEVKAGEKFMGVTVSEDYMTLQLNEGGTGSLSTQGVSADISWKKEGDVIKVSSSDENAGDILEFKIDGNKLYVDKDGMSFVLKK